MSEEQASPARPALRIVHGAPTPEELAVVTALVTAAASSGNGNGNGDGAEARRVGRWNDPGAQHRRPWRPGPDAWRTIYR